MSLDSEIKELERRVVEGDTSALAEIDEVLYRAVLPARRIWYVHWITGEYSDRVERFMEPVHFTKSGALAHMRALAEAENYRPDPEEGYRSNYGYMNIYPMAVER